MLDKQWHLLGPAQKQSYACLQLGSNVDSTISSLLRLSLFVRKRVAVTRLFQNELV